MAAAQELVLEVRLESPAAPSVSILSTPRIGHGSVFRRNLTEALAGLGPSPVSAEELARFITTWNLDGVELLGTTTPTRQGDSWRWEATLGPWPDSVLVRLWPLTWVEESYISRVRFIGSGLKFDGGGAPDFTSTWIRPTPMHSIDSFLVRLPR